MQLSEHQKEELQRAIEDYAFPPDYFDFVRNAPERQANTKAVEVKINTELTSGDPERVKNGLSNVLYWGYARMGIRDFRVQRFRTKVTAPQLRNSGELFHRCSRPSVVRVRKLGLPEFSGLSFVSKIRMFLDPDNSATLDWQIMRIHGCCPETLLAGFRVGKNATQIQITTHNARAYEAWCGKVKQISKRYFNGQLRAADVERGFFQLVQCGKAALAAQILKLA
jgi:hypothetical protein